MPCPPCSLRLLGLSQAPALALVLGAELAAPLHPAWLLFCLPCRGAEQRLRSPSGACGQAGSGLCSEPLCPFPGTAGAPVPAGVRTCPFQLLARL